jgi:hypothetical protein
MLTVRNNLNLLSKFFFFFSPSLLSKVFWVKNRNGQGAKEKVTLVWPEMLINTVNITATPS